MKEIERITRIAMNRYCSALFLLDIQIDPADTLFGTRVISFCLKRVVTQIHHLSFHGVTCETSQLF